MSLADVLIAEALNNPVPYQLRRNLSAFWPLSESSGTRRDLSGNALTLTDNNTVTGNTGPSNAIPASSEFVGANSESLSRVNSAPLQAGDIEFTIAGWYYFSAAAWEAVLCKGSSLDGAGLEYSISVDADASSNVLLFYVRNTANTASTFIATGAGQAKNAWHFFVAQHDPTANIISIQLDGGTIATTAHSGGILASTGALHLGSTSVPNRFFTGRQNHIGIWKRLLTNRETTWMRQAATGRTLSALRLE